MVKTIAECVKCAERLQYNGIISKPYYNERKERNLNEFKEGKLQLLVVCGKLLEGFDHPKVCICAFMYKVKSYVRFSQFAGRCIRIDRNNSDSKRAFLFGPRELTTFFNRLNNEENEELPVEEPPIEEPPIEEPPIEEPPIEEPLIEEPSYVKSLESLKNLNF